MSLMSIVSLIRYFQDVCALWPQPSRRGFSLCTHDRYNHRRYLGIFISWKWWWVILLRHKVFSIDLADYRDTVYPIRFTGIPRSAWDTIHNLVTYALAGCIYSTSLSLYALVIAATTISHVHIVSVFVEDKSPPYTLWWSLRSISPCSRSQW